eukprot:365802-Chlamydomonas_euryale.AAC.18
MQCYAGVEGYKHAPWSGRGVRDAKARLRGSEAPRLLGSEAPRLLGSQAPRLLSYHLPGQGVCSGRPELGS